MKRDYTKVLFLTQGDSLSGVPILLLYLIQWYSTHVGKASLIIERGGGTLLPDFKDVSRVFIGLPIKNATIRLFNRITFNAYLFTYCLIVRLLERPTVVFASELNVSRAALLAFRGIRIISGCHMLKDSLINYDRVDRSVSNQVSVSSRIICCAQTVKKSLLELYPSLNPGHLHVIPEYIPVSDYATFRKRCAESRSTDIDSSHYSINLQIHMPLFVMCGPATHRKGFDYWLPLAKAFANISKLDQFMFLWIGASMTDQQRSVIYNQASDLGLSGKVAILPPTSSFQKILLKATAFCLVSREDPMPLVALEAAALDVPIACFADSGDIPFHFTSSSGDMGCLVSPMGDVVHMAQGLNKILSSNELRSSLIAQAYSVVSTQNTFANCKDICNLLGAA